MVFTFSSSNKPLATKYCKFSAFSKLLYSKLTVSKFSWSFNASPFAISLHLKFKTFKFDSSDNTEISDILVPLILISSRFFNETD